METPLWNKFWHGQHLISCFQCRHLPGFSHNTQIMATDCNYWLSLIYCIECCRSSDVFFFFFFFLYRPHVRQHALYLFVQILWVVRHCLRDTHCNCMAELWLGLHIIIMTSWFWIRLTLVGCLIEDRELHTSEFWRFSSKKNKLSVCCSTVNQTRAAQCARHWRCLIQTKHLASNQ